MDKSGKGERRTILNLLLHTTAFTLMTTLLAVAGLLVLFVFPPKPPAKVTDNREIV